MYTYYISVGSNIGNRHKYIQSAFQFMAQHDEVVSIMSSNLVETEPWGYEEQAAFLNGAWKCTSTMDPLTMLEVLQGLEKAAHRERLIHWGPRTLDLDIIYVLDDHGKPLEIHNERLHIPHPYFWERLFVLEPLRELEPSFMYHGTTIEQRIQLLTNI